jgi:GNAT superfamily N-acetyltransferase
LQLRPGEARGRADSVAEQYRQDVDQDLVDEPPLQALARPRPRRGLRGSFPPDWRITCFFVDKDYRGQGVAAAALEGALREIARLDGGRVETYPEAVDETRSVSGSFLNNATVAMFERHGFERSRPLGKHHWLMTKVVIGPRAGRS